MHHYLLKVTLTPQYYVFNACQCRKVASFEALKLKAKVKKHFIPPHHVHPLALVQQSVSSSEIPALPLYQVTWKPLPVTFHTATVYTILKLSGIISHKKNQQKEKELKKKKKKKAQKRENIQNCTCSVIWTNSSARESRIDSIVA